MSTYALISAKYEITSVIEPDGYLVGVTESTHAVQGQSLHFELEQMPGAYFSRIVAICERHELDFYVTGKGKNVFLTVY